MSNPTKIKKLNDYELAVKYLYYKNLFKIQYKLETLEKIKKDALMNVFFIFGEKINL